MTPDLDMLHKHAQRLLREQNQAAHGLHRQFLQLQRSGLERLAWLAERELGQGGSAAPPAAASVAAVRTGPPLFDHRQLEEFARGSVTACFGPEFSRYERQRHPRIPNGDLLMMSRVVEIQGQRGQFGRSARIVSEYDVPAEAWFYQGANFTSLPYALWMEIALQPCGFLAAYLGTALRFPQVAYYFRNLDGSAQLLHDLDVRGQTLTCRAELHSSVVSGATIIQKFTFQCACQGQVLFSGESVFGFFPPEAMAAQAGLDAGKPTPFPPAVDWIDLEGLQAEARFFQAPGERPHQRLMRGRLQLLDRLAFLPAEGPQQSPQVLGQRTNQPQDWFYSYHFFLDPVMPGSLGVEAAFQALQAYALASGLADELHNPRFGLVEGRPLAWKYRGQILPGQREMRLALRVGAVERSPGQRILSAEASLWADAVRIYELKGLAVQLYEA
jgi:3-hydroxymyristoyl/3-hydroxydecanoyl-(acyl carrier protein) dehydratase